MIQYYNRAKNILETEKVAGGKYIDWMYSSKVGMSLLEKVVKKKWLSTLYGKYCDRPMSKKRVASFVEQFQIDLSKYEEPEGGYQNFNDFFIRKVKKEARPIAMEKDILISCGDGRALLYENIDTDKVIQVKDFTYSLEELLGSKDMAKRYQGGSCFVLRLAPVDYHRFHFIDSGICEKPMQIPGQYYSVNPKALEIVANLYCQNKREISVFHSDTFGRVAYVEVGATFVGSIVQTFESNKKVSKGDEKGYFKFGGSTVILFFEPDTIQWDADLVYHSEKGIETKLYMGEPIGKKMTY